MWSSRGAGALKDKTDGPMGWKGSWWNPGTERIRWNTVVEGRASRPNPFHFPFSFDARHFERYRRYESEEFRFGKKKTILVYWTATIDPLELAKKKNHGNPIQRHTNTR